MNISKRTPNLADIKKEKKILTGFIIDTDFLSNISLIYKENLFRKTYMNQIASWCIDFYKNYAKAPKKHIEDIFNHIDFGKENDIVDKFLSDLSDEYEQDNSSEYQLDEAVKYFERFRIQNIIKDTEKSLINEDIETAKDIIKNYESVKKIKIDAIDVYSPDIDIFSEQITKENFLFSLPGELGKFTGDIERGDLISVVAPTGVGKSWWLQFIAEAATMNGINVLFISLEMSKRQMLKRFRSSLTKRPVDEPLNILLPKFDCYHNQIGTCDSFRRINRTTLYNNDELPEFDKAPRGYKMCTACRGEKIFEPAIWFKKIYRNNITDEYFLKFKKKALPILNRRGKIHFMDFPMKSVNFDEIADCKNTLELKYNIKFGLLVTDYADEFSTGYAKEYRHQIGQIWSDHKKFAQKYNMGVITASQSNTSRDPYKNIGRGDLEEAILKLNLCDGMFSINQFPNEKKSGLYRIRQMKKRSRKYSLIDECHVLSCLEIGRPYLDGIVQPIPGLDRDINKKGDDK